MRIDDVILNGDYGHYVRILNDIDLPSSLPSELMLERNGACLFISLLYENLPKFCSTCNSLGNSSSSCHWKETDARTNIKEHKTSKAPRCLSQVLRGHSKSRMAYMCVERSENMLLKARYHPSNQWRLIIPELRLSFLNH